MWYPVQMSSNAPAFTQAAVLWSGGKWAFPSVIHRPSSSDSPRKSLSSNPKWCIFFNNTVWTQIGQGQPCGLPLAEGSVPGQSLHCQDMELRVSEGVPRRPTLGPRDPHPLWTCLWVPYGWNHSHGLWFVLWADWGMGCVWGNDGGRTDVNLLDT